MTNSITEVQEEAVAITDYTLTHSLGERIAAILATLHQHTQELLRNSTTDKEFADGIRRAKLSIEGFLKEPELSWTHADYLLDACESYFTTKTAPSDKALALMEKSSSCITAIPDDREPLVVVSVHRSAVVPADTLVLVDSTKPLVEEITFKQWGFNQGLEGLMHLTKDSSIGQNVECMVWDGTSVPECHVPAAFAFYLIVYVALFSGTSHFMVAHADGTDLAEHYKDCAARSTAKLKEKLGAPSYDN